MVPKTLAQAIKRWPAADLGELLGLIAQELHARAEHHAKGGGIKDELAKRQRVAGRREK
jgi:hypothetical protein